MVFVKSRTVRAAGTGSRIIGITSPCQTAAMDFLPIHERTGIPLHELEALYRHITSGCDERIYPNADGLNSYGFNLFDYDGLLHRGSCTCGQLSDDAMLLMAGLCSREPDYGTWVEEQTRTIKSLINYDGQDRFDVFFAPSGSDLAYLPALFCRIMHPDRPVLNLLSCPEELGSGTLAAVRGNYHAAFNQFDEAVPKGENVYGDIPVKVVPLMARGSDGRIVNHRREIRAQMDAHPGHSVIMSLVFGSKSGIEDNLDILEDAARDDILYTVDMCQFRHSRKIIHRILDHNGCVMLTGSKFYQAPPFCGAMLVSKPLMERLERGDPSPFARLDRLFSSWDFPVSLRGASGLTDRRNMGLRLRWSCALREMALFRDIPRHLTELKIDAWNAAVTQWLRVSPAFELMPDMELTNKTIISFRVRRDGRFLGHGELRGLYREIVTAGRIGPGRGRPVYIGQPVAYGEKSFLRLAIGSMCIREFVENDETAFDDDKALIELIASKTAVLEKA